MSPFSTAGTHWLAFLAGAALATEVVGLVIGNDALAVGAMIPGAVAGLVAIFYLGRTATRRKTKETP